MSRDLSLGNLAALLGTGLAYSKMARLAGVSDGRSLRRLCHERGLRRQIRHGVVIVIAEPAPQRAEGA